MAIRCTGRKARRRTGERRRGARRRATPPRARPAPPNAPPSLRIARSAGLAPEQVATAASANVTLELRLNGADVAQVGPLVASALSDAFSELSQGFEPARIVVAPLPLAGPPPAAATVTAPSPAPPAAAAAAASAAGAQPNGTLAEPRAADRRRLQADAAKEPGGSAGGARQAAASQAGLPASLAKRAPQQKAAGDEQQRQESGQLQGQGPPDQPWTNSVTVAFTGMSLASVPLLLQALDSTCGLALAGTFLPGGPPASVGRCICGRDVTELAARRALLKPGAAATLRATE
jgi:hypothetical protein